MRFYEFAFIAQQGLLQQEVGALVQEFEVLLSKIGANLVKHEYWGLKDLAYEIKKCTKGHYCLLYIQATCPVFDEFKRKVRLKEEVVRSFCLVVPFVPSTNSPMIASESE